MDSKTSDLAAGRFPEYLLSENQIDSEVNQALFHAARAGNKDGVVEALNAGGKPNYFYHPQDHKNALHAAAEGGYLEIVDILLQHGAAINALTAKDHATPLILAATQDRVDVVIRLIAAQADLSAANGYGNTALHEACYCGHFANARALIEAGAPVNQLNNKGSTPLHMFCYGEKVGAHTVEMAEYLLNEGANVNIADTRGMTPLLVVCSTGREDLVELFLARGALASAKDFTRRGPADIARFYRHGHIAALFEGDQKQSDDKDCDSKDDGSSK